MTNFMEIKRSHNNHGDNSVTQNLGFIVFYTDRKLYFYKNF